MNGHPSPIGHGWKNINGKCRPVSHTRAALPDNFSWYVVHVDCDGEYNVDIDDNDDENDSTDGESEYSDTEIDEV